jgi:hypothetical protein
MRFCRSVLLQIFLSIALAACGGSSGDPDEGANDGAANVEAPSEHPATAPPEQPTTGDQQAPPQQPDLPNPAPPPSAPEPEPDPGTPDTTPPDIDALAAAERAAERTAAFVTAETIDALSYGLVGDGRTDNTQIFRSLLTGGNRTIHVQPGDYVTGRLEFAPRTILVLAPGVTIRDSGLLGTHDRLLNIQTHDVQIVGLGARVVGDRSRYTTGEWRHGVYIYGASRVLIDGLESSSQGGDGFYIGGPAGRPSTDVQIRGCRADDNRRQGLSITSARRVQIVDCEFTSTHGTAPEFGVDLEPNAGYDTLDHIVILRAQTATNAGGGIMVYLDRLTSTSEPVDVTIVDHTSDAEPVSLLTHVPAGVTALLRYGSSAGSP